MRHRADIDGLRAIAVGAVIAEHLGVPGVAGGYVGVDVFFVISGYLITALIAPAVAARRFALGAFYERRIRRIAPAFFVVTAATTVAAWWLLPPRDLGRYGDSLTATSTLSANILFWRQEGYFDSAAALKPMLHVWSLAVEEQFYLVYPLLLAGLYRAWPRRAPAVLAVLGLASLVACVWATTAAPRLAFYLMPPRAWELGLGAALALGAAPTLRGRAVRELAAALGLALIAAAIVGFSSRTAFPGVAALVPCLGAALVIHAHADPAAPPTLIARGLALAPLGYLGAISYSLYLWHWPLLVMTRYLVIAPGPAHLAAVGAATLALASLSWRFVERPLRRPSPTRPRRTVFVAWAAATIATLAFGLATARARGWPGRVAPAVRALDAAAADFNHDRPRCHGYDRRPIAYAAKCVYGRPGATPTMALWGDSMAVELAAGLAPSVTAAGGALRLISYSSCPPAAELAFRDRPGCLRHDREMLAQLTASPTVRTVILVAQYRRYLGRFGPRFLADFAAVATALARAGKQVVVVYPIPSPPGPVPSLLARRAMRGGAPTEVAIPRAAYDAESQAIVAALDRLTAQLGVIAVRPADRLCDATRCALSADGRVLYWDDRHLSVAGATYLAPLFAAVVAAAVSPPPP